MSTQIFAIRNKETGEFQAYNSRCAWTKAGNAKNAFAQRNKVWVNNVGFVTIKFDEQDTYELVNLTDVYYRLEGLEK